MVGIVEGVLIVGALCLDVYAYKKMKDAEELAEKSRTTADARTTILTGTTHETTALEPVAAGIGTSPAAVSHEEETREETHEWEKPPVTYAPLAADSATAEEIRLMREDLKGDLSNLGERIEVLEERVKENQSSTEEKFQFIESRFETAGTPAIDEEKIAQGIADKLSKKQGQLSKKLDDHYKKILDVENKVDSALISAPDTQIIKKDLREEFAPLLGLGKKMDEHQAKTVEKINALSKKVGQNRETLESRLALLKKRTSVRRVTAGPAKPAAKTAKKAKAKTSSVTKAKKTRTVSVRKTSAKKTANKSANKNAEVTVTTQVPKGVQVSTEVVTGKKK